MEKNEFDVHSAGNGTAVFSPVSGLAAAFSSQSLETPRRRLSLDTDASSGTPLDTPGRLALIVEVDTPDSSHISETVAEDSPTTVVMDEAGLDGQNDASTGSAKCMSNSVQAGQTMSKLMGERKGVCSLAVPSFVFSSFRSARSSSGSSGEDLRTPGVMISPAPSPVFALDEDSRDSGYGGEAPPTTATAPTSVSSDEGLFLHPRAKGTKTQTATSFKIFDDGFDITEDDEMFEAMHVDDPADTPPGRMEPIACLLSKRILYEGDKKSPEETQVPESYDGTPLKRKQSGRLTRCGSERQHKVFRNDASAKRSVHNENDDESRDVHSDLNVPSGFKRRKSLVETRFTSMRVPLKPLNRSHSEADAFFALHKDDTCHLIGDQSMPHALPIMDRPHVNDLKCISSDTLRRLLNGEFDGVVDKYTLFDCRYPYEYEGGHIRGAHNVYTQEELTVRLLDESVMAAAASSMEQSKRQIFIFYCEFSRERGPRMTRFLRKCDRKLNEHQYPRLFYPEIYLLDGGYKNFYATCKDLCEPQSYRPMHDENHVNELRKFRSKSKSWCSSGGDSGDGLQTRRPGLNRGLFSSKGY